MEWQQHADSTVTTSLVEVDKLVDKRAQTVVSAFYHHPDYQAALAASVKPHLEAPWDHLLLSFHGLPERHITRSDPTKEHCLASGDCCDVASMAHKTCYRHQCFATAHNLAAALQLDNSQYTVSFQSRLGRLPWLTPYTDAKLRELAHAGVKRLVVACPAFVADNLETLEEIGIQGRETFIAAGGEHLELVPCLNDHPQWVDGFSRILQDHLPAPDA